MVDFIGVGPHHGFMPSQLDCHCLKSRVDERLHELRLQGIDLPRPSEVRLIQTDDFEVDAVQKLILEFSADIKAGEASWKKLRPLLFPLLDLVEETSDLPVIYEIVRHGDR